MSRTYKGIINQDFIEVEKLIKLKTINYELDYENIFQRLKLFHRYFYELRDILEELDYQNSESYNAMQDGIEGIFDFIWLIIFSRYKSSIITFRSSIEMLIKGLVRGYCPEIENNSFSNNVEKLIKEFKTKIQIGIHGSRKKKSLSKFLHENYTTEIERLYKDLSNIVHGNYISREINFSKYLQEITEIKTNYNEEKFTIIINDAIKLLRYILELSIMINFNYLNENMNNYKFSLILEDLSCEFKEFKREYL